MPTTYLCIGHICMDVIPQGYQLGGTASYVSKLTSALGYSTSILTSYGPDFLFEKDFKNIAIHNTKSTHSTVFENDYSQGIRKQILHSKASNIEKYELQETGFDIIHFCPIADEIDFKIIQQFSKTNALTLATPQGWMRQWNADGLVSFKTIDWSKLSGIDVVIISEEDVPNLENELPHICSHISKLIVTRGGNGADLYWEGKVKHFPAHPTTPIDTTGAGDTFAAAFITAFQKTKDLEQAIIYANCLASLCVESVGVDFFNKLGELENRMAFFNA